MNKEANQAADLAQLVADLKKLCDTYKAALSGYHPLANYMQQLSDADKLPVGVLGRHYGDAAVKHMRSQEARIADMGAQRDKLQHEHHTVRADAQARVDAAVIRALAAEKERDELRATLAACTPHLREREDGTLESPADMLALRELEALGLLGRLSAAQMQAHGLRARLAEMERQEPVAWIANTPHSYCTTKLYARPAAAIPDGWKLVNAGALAMVVNALRRDAEEGRPVRGEMANELIAAPEYKA